MKLAAFIGIAVSLAVPGAAQNKAPSAPKRPPVSKPAAKSAKKAAKPAATSSTGYRSSAQVRPTAQRYREIQQALAGKGYFQGAVDGNWGPDSIDALKRFQREQKLVDDGKIGSLSLIALGLGSPHGVVPAGAPEAKP